MEAGCIFRLDFERFLALLSKEERNIFLKKLESFTNLEIADDFIEDVAKVRRWLKMLCGNYISWFGLNWRERCSLFMLEFLFIKLITTISLISFTTGGENRLVIARIRSVYLRSCVLSVKAQNLPNKYNIEFFKL